MIFISVGSVSYSFSRLVNRVYSDLHGKNEKVVIQSGFNSNVVSSRNIVVKQFFSYQEMISLYKSARLNISAAGEGSCILLSMYSKNKFVLVPRKKIFNEHVDDQQCETANYFLQRDKAWIINDINDLQKKYATRSVKNQRLNAELFENTLAKSLIKMIS